MFKFIISFSSLTL